MSRLLDCWLTVVVLVHLGSLCPWFCLSLVIDAGVFPASVTLILITHKSNYLAEQAPERR
jgi:hypothetical protein